MIGTIVFLSSRRYEGCIWLVTLKGRFSNFTSSRALLRYVQVNSSGDLTRPDPTVFFCQNVRDDCLGKVTKCEPDISSRLRMA